MTGERDVWPTGFNYPDVRPVFLQRRPPGIHGLLLEVSEKDSIVGDTGMVPIA